jgi:hypothetical protein
VPRYIQGFKISQGTVLAGYRLFSVHIDHVTVTRYRLYEYPTVLRWTKINQAATPEQIMSALQSYLYPGRVMYTAYGNFISAFWHLGCAKHYVLGCDDNRSR